MPWKEVEPLPAPSRQKSGVRFGISTRYGAIVTLKKNILDELGWSPDDKIKVWQGHGNEEGRIRFQVAADGKIAMQSSPKGDSKRIYARLSFLSDDTYNLASVAYSVIKNVKALEIVLPDGALKAAS